VNRQKHRPPAGGVRAQRACDVAALSQVEAFEWLVGQQDRPGDQQADRQQRAFALSFG